MSNVLIDPIVIAPRQRLLISQLTPQCFDYRLKCLLRGDGNYPS